MIGTLSLQAPAVEKDEALERLKEEQQRTRESRMALQQAHAMSVNIDAELLANAVAVPGMQEVRVSVDHTSNKGTFMPGPSCADSSVARTFHIHA